MTPRFVGLKRLWLRFTLVRRRPPRGLTVSGEQRLRYRPLAFDDDPHELAGAAAHRSESGVAALEESLQLAQSREQGGPLTSRSCR